MYLRHLSLTNFRKFTRLDIDLPKGVILLTGGNAQGKTTLLEAVYFLAAFTSFQTHADRQIVNVEEAKKGALTVTRLTAEFQRGKHKHRLEVRLILEPVGVLNGQRLRKEILLDGVKKPAGEAVGRFNAVIFVPQMSQIIEGPPDDRRRYLNLTLAQSVPAYVRVLGEYNQALTQRNALLKALSEGSGSRDQLEVWDEALSRLGAQIILWRIGAVQRLEHLAARVHHELTHGTEILRLAYEPAYDPLPKPNRQLGLKIDTAVDRSGLGLDEIQRGFCARLKELRNEEIARGVTTIGPHRDELRFLANDFDLGNYGSRGQIRTALLSLKLAEVNWLKERTGEWPVILLDEVMAELDLQRRADLLHYIGGSEQVLFTTTDLNLFAPGFVEQAEVWKVESGGVKK
ncbi:MAG: DNA replication/repair protein RecF [Anaerolineales bacterium]